METEVTRLVFLNMPGIWGWMFIFLLFALVIYGSLKSTRRLQSGKRRSTLLFLHITSFFLITLILLNPAVRTENYEEEKPNLAVLVDTSWSMNLESDRNGNSRIKSVRKFIDRNDNFFSQIENNFRVNYYLFDESLSKISPESVFTNEPFGKSTDIRGAIQNLKEEYKLEGLDEVILFSDGKDTGSSFEDSGDFLENRDFRINTISATEGKGKPDIWIDEIKSSEVAFLRYPLSVDIRIRSEGYGNMKIPLTLKEGDEVLSVKEVSMSDSGEGEATFTLRPVSLGTRIYTAFIPEVSGELTEKNNRQSFATEVVVNRIRVLHVAGSPSWDVRFLRKALKRNPKVDLISFFILRDPSDLVFASQDELSLIPFPVNEIFGEQLPTFDVVVFQNFNFRPFGIYDKHFMSLNRYVQKDGGAFLMIGGDRSFESGNYGMTPVSEILPIELSYIPKRAEEAFSEGEFRAELSPIGTRHPVMNIAQDSQENMERWENLPEIEGYNTNRGLKSDATPLLLTPDGDPLFAVNPIGTGKVASFLSDSSWKWNFVRAGEGDISHLYDQFWNRLLLWLIDDPDLDEIRLNTDKSTYTPGETPEVEIWALRGEEEELDLESSAVFPSGREKMIELKRGGSEDEFSSEINTDEYGIHKIVASFRRDRSDTLTGKSETEFIVKPPEKELRGPTTDENLLMKLSKETGGGFIKITDDPEDLGIDPTPRKRITGYSTERLWDTPWFFIALVGILSADWILRRRWGLR